MIRRTRKFYFIIYIKVYHTIIFRQIEIKDKSKIPLHTLQIRFENFIHELEKYVTGHWDDSGSKQV